MFGLFVKMVLCPSVVYLSDMLFNQINYANWYQPLLVGFILAIGAHTMELLMLNTDTVWLSTIVDFAVAAAIIYYSGVIFPNASISFTGATITAGLLAVTEYFQHSILIQSGKVIK